MRQVGQVLLRHGVLLRQGVWRKGLQKVQGTSGLSVCGWQELLLRVVVCLRSEMQLL
jgi:hypothetical protein